MYLHHCIAGQPLHDMEIDHVNRDGTDNRRSNLRVVSKNVNRANSKLYANNKTGYRGVRHSGYGKYFACITINGKSKHLGTFETAEQASQAYQKQRKV